MPENLPPSSCTSKPPLLPTTRARRLSKLPASPFPVTTDQRAASSISEEKTAATSKGSSSTFTATLVDDASNRPSHSSLVHDGRYSKAGSSMSLASRPDSPLATPPKRMRSAAIGEAAGPKKLLDAYGLPSSHQRRKSGMHATAKRNIVVCVRKKPISNRSTDVAELEGSEAVVINEPRLKLDGSTKYIEQHRFEFDRVFDGHVGNGEIYEAAVKSLVDTAGTGGRATCFAYGQTGSGKTHTMFHAQDGICFQAVRDMLQWARGLGMQLTVSAYEIYRGTLYDLLASRHKVMACEDADGHIRILNLCDETVADDSEARAAIRRALDARSTGSTGANRQSSRSHAVLQMTLLQDKGLRHGQLSFIDLAGSERGVDRADSAAHATHIEGSEINKSLLALKECIRAIDQGSSHQPFRQSKLTQVLKESFVSEGARTLMLAVVNATAANCEHTLNTLRYADRVRDLCRTVRFKDGEGGNDKRSDEGGKSGRASAVGTLDSPLGAGMGSPLGKRRFSIGDVSPPRGLSLTATEDEDGTSQTAAVAARGKIASALEELSLLSEQCDDVPVLETLADELCSLLEALRSTQ